MKIKPEVAVVFAVLALVMASCSSNPSPSGSGSAAPASDVTLIHGTTDSIVAIDPAGQYDLGSAQPGYQIFDTLLAVPAQGNTAEPSLADSCEYDDPVTYTCKLHPMVTFSDGSELTSEDVAYSFQRNIEINDPQGACSLLIALADCGKWHGNEIDTPDPSTVRFNLRNPDATWPFVLTSTAGFIVPDSYPPDKLQPDADNIGSGHYMISEYRPGEQLVLDANPNYWGDPALNARVIIQYFDKSSALKLALEQGEVDVGWRTFTPTDVEGMRTNPDLNVLTGPGAEIRYLGFNLSLSPGDEYAVRKAVAMTVDRQAIADDVYNGTVTPLWSMVPSALVGHVDAFKNEYGDAPDLEGATKVLEEAGVSTPVPIEIWWTPTHYGDASADEYAEIERALEGSGLFDVTLKSTEWEQYSNDVVTDHYPAFQLGWFPDYPDPDNYVYTFYAETSYLNDHYANPKVQTLLSDERTTTDQNQRVSDIEEIQRIGAQDVPLIPIWEGTQLAVAGTNVIGVQETLDVAYIFRYWLIGKTE